MTAVAPHRQPARPVPAWTGVTPAHDPAGGPARRSRPLPVAAAEAALCAAIAVVLATSLGRAVAGASVVLMALTAAAAAAALELVLARRGWAPSTSALAGAGAALVTCAVVGLEVAPTPVALLDTARAVFDAPRRWLSAPLPLPDRPELVVLVPAVAWLVAQVATAVAVRRRAVFAPLVPVALLAAGLPLLSAGVGPPSLARLGLLVALGGTLVLLRALAPDATVAASVRSARTRARRRLAIGVPLVVVVTVLAPPAADRLPGADTEAVDLRSVPEGDPSRARSPLAEVNGRVGGIDRDVFLATLSPVPEGSILFRAVALDDYDGAVWAASAPLEPVGAELPAPPPLAADEATALTQEIELVDPLDRFLPAAGMPTDLTGLTVRRDPLSGALATADGEVPAPGTSYATEAVLVVPTEAELAAAVRDRSGDDIGAAIDSVPDSGALASFATREIDVRRADIDGSPDARALFALVDLLSDGDRYAFDQNALAGHSLRRLTDFAVGPGAGDPSGPDDGASEGDDVDRGGRAPGVVTEGGPEQFAASFAVMARTLGFASRVAVGYRAGAPGPDGLVRVTSRQAFAWAEIKLVGLGWVAFVASPDEGDDAGPVAPDLGDDGTTTTVPPPPPPPPPTEPAGPDPDLDSEAVAGGGRIPPGVAAAIAMVVTALAGVVATSVGGRWWRRRRRRRAADAAERTVGAWDEVRERLVDARIVVHRAMTTTEVAAAVAVVADPPVPGAAEAVAGLGALVNRARFAGAPTADAAAGQAWALADRAAAALAPRRPLGDRIRQALDPRAPARRLRPGASFPVGGRT